tara:strand:- start:45 stop:239 length:195 start_codon:yes stop_codon:yes gene_type:complete
LEIRAGYIFLMDIKKRIGNVFLGKEITQPSTPERAKWARKESPTITNAITGQKAEGFTLRKKRG